jgi:hypothetical protein
MATKQRSVAARPQNANGEKMSIPQNEDTLLNRKAVAAALTEAGFPVKPATLATKASRGGGPPYQLFGRVPVYRWSSAVAWAQSKLSDPVRNTSESSANAAA